MKELNYQEIAAQVKKDAFKLGILSVEIRNRALENMASALERNKEEIFSANRRDLENAESAGVPQAIYDRLKFGEGKLADVVSGMRGLITLADPVGRILIERELEEGLLLKKITCPIGVIGVIFESRPDALVQISALCVKSGNCAILKGGSEAAHTNRALFDILRTAGIEAGLPDKFMTLIESRAGISELLKCDKHIDLLIPRGSNEFVKYIMDNSRIPVMGHADGVCHIYVDKSADIEKAIPIIIDAKTQYVAACNTVETLLIHGDIAAELLPGLKKAFAEKKLPGGAVAELRGDERVREFMDIAEAGAGDFGHEYLDYILAIKVVDSIDDAIAHINLYGSHHTDCIVAEDDALVEQFMNSVDSAGVYRNCSTRFADGYRYGFGAEIGISTGKLHARGPVGLDGLITYKYKLYGSGNIVEGFKPKTFSD